MKRYDVLAVGYYGFGNLGDELLASAVVKGLTGSGVPRERIALLSATPRETSQSLGVDAFDRWKLSAIVGAMKQSRSLLLGGGGLFQDSTSSRSCVYYWGLVRLARLLGLKVWAVGQSIGPLHGGLAKSLAREAFASCVYRAVRDERSENILSSWNMNSTLTDDLVTSLVVNAKYMHGRTMLLNLRPGYDDLASRSAAAAMKRAETEGMSVRGVAFSDEDAVELEKYSSAGVLKLVQITVVKSLADYENVMQGACAAVGMRLHFTVMASLAGLPCAAVPYDPKVSAFCERWNVPLFASAESEFSRPAAEEIKLSADGIRKSFRAGLCAVLGENYGRNQA